MWTYLNEGIVMDLQDSYKFLGYFLLFAALILIAVGDFISLTLQNSLVGNSLLLLGIFVAIFGIFVLVG
jgi:hypothetical protein